MATLFYGPWLVVQGPGDTHFSQRVLIAGSSNADGIYQIGHGQSLVLFVQGVKWTLEMQYFPFDEGATFQPSQVRETMKFVPGAGLIVQLDGAARPPTVLNPQFDDLTFTCTSMDPEVNPIPGPNPYDFTIPRDSHREESGAHPAERRKSAAH